MGELVGMKKIKREKMSGRIERGKNKWERLSGVKKMESRGK